jgi:hypothetical protein
MEPHVAAPVRLRHADLQNLEARVVGEADAGSVRQRQFQA